MKQTDSSVTTGIARHTSEAAYVRGADQVKELMGKLTFAEMILFHLTGQRPGRRCSRSAHCGAKNPVY